MADISKPNEVVTEKNGPSGSQETTDNDQRAEKTGAIRGAEMSPDPTDEDKSSSNKQDRYEHLRTVVAIAALTVSILALVASIFAAVASNKSAAAARRSAEVGIAATRAWIVAQRWTNLRLTSDSRFTGDLNLRNIGRTPATEVNTTYETLFVSQPDRKKPTFEGCPTQPPASPGIIPVDQEWDTEIISDPLTKQEVEMLKNRTARIFIHFCTTYKDVIVPGATRVTEGAFSWPVGSDESTISLYSQYFRMK